MCGIESMDMTRPVAILIIGLIGLAAPALAADSALVIDARRLTVMMSEAREIETTLGLNPPPEPAVPSTDDVPALLGQAIDSYNGLAQQACAARAIEAALCTGPYRPAWRAPASAAPDDASLRRWTDETAQRLTPFWSALCAKAPKPDDSEPVCPME